MAQAFIMPTNDMLEQQHQTALLARPEAKRMTQLEQEMANILSRTDLTERQKMELFGLTLQNFRRVQGEIINKGLMLTQTTGPAAPPTDNSVFDKIQTLLQQAMADETISESPSQQSPNKKQKLTPAVLKFRDQLLRQNNIYLDTISNEYVVAGTNMSPDIFHTALKTIISNKDPSTTDPAIRAATETIFKTYLTDGNINPTQFARYKYFQGLASNFQQSPRAPKRKRKSSNTPSYTIKKTPRPRRLQGTKRHQSGHGILSHEQFSNGNVNFELWDKK